MGIFKGKLSYLIIIVFLCCLFSFISPVFAVQDISKDRSYIYKKNLEVVPIPDPYRLEKIINVVYKDGTVVKNPIDMFVTKDNRVFVLDSDEGAVLIYDREFNLIKVIEHFYLEGHESPLNKPEGLFVSNDNMLYIADTQNNRIIKSDINGNICGVIKKPEVFIGTSVDVFLPTKVVLDSIGRLLVIARNINMGIMQFDAEGNFLGYIGAPRVRLSAMERFWRKLSTHEQRQKMTQFVPTEYDNIKIDEKGFIWGTISSLSAEEINDAIAGNTAISPVKKINFTGNDVLKKKGFFPPVGDVRFFDSPSKIVDVALGPAGIYSLLDRKDGKIFTYDDDGNLLHVFGRIGNLKGNFERPIAIDYLGNKIVVLDNALNQLIVFEPTDYGQIIIEAIEAYVKGDYEESYKKWSEIAQLNVNFQYAFIGLGKAKLSEGNYKDALNYFQYADYAEGYSKAKEMLRKEQLRVIFPFIFVALIVLSFLLIVRNIIRKFKEYIRNVSAPYRYYYGVRDEKWEN